MLTVAVPKRNKLPNIIVLTPKDGSVVANIKEETPAMPAGGAGMGMM